MAEGSGCRPLSGFKGFLSTCHQLSARASYRKVTHPIAKASSYPTLRSFPGGVLQKWEKGHLIVLGRTTEVLQECQEGGVGVKGRH